MHGSYVAFVAGRWSLLVGVSSAGIFKVFTFGIFRMRLCFTRVFFGISYERSDFNK